MVPQSKNLKHVADRLAWEDDVLPGVLRRVALDTVLIERVVVVQHHRLHHRSRHVFTPRLAGPYYEGTDDYRTASVNRAEPGRQRGAYA